MSNIQEILKALAVALHDGLIGEEGCEDLAKALNGVPTEYHMNAFRALLGIEPTNEDAFEKPAEAPEDYLAVKTFTSSDFHVGDEVVVCNDRKGVYLATDTIIGSCLLMDSGELACYFDKDAWTRTGRNFQAIPAVLEELKKA